MAQAQQRPILELEVRKKQLSFYIANVINCEYIKIELVQMSLQFSNFFSRLVFFLRVLGSLIPLRLIFLFLRRIFLRFTFVSLIFLLYLLRRVFLLYLLRRASSRQRTRASLWFLRLALAFGQFRVP